MEEEYWEYMKEDRLDIDRSYSKEFTQEDWLDFSRELNRKFEELHSQGYKDIKLNIDGDYEQSYDDDIEGFVNIYFSYYRDYTKEEKEQMSKAEQIQKDIQKVTEELKAKGLDIKEAVILANTPSYRENYLKGLLK